MKGTDLNGMDKVMRNLNAEVSKIKGASLQGAIRAVGFLHTDMEKTAPVVPRDTGFLRASWFSTIFPGVVQKIIFGFSANYAWFVHEMVGADFTSPRWRWKKGKKKYWYTPVEGAGAKFMEYAIKRNEKQILEYIQGSINQR